MRTMAIMFMGVSLSSRDKVAPPVTTRAMLGEVMALPTVTVAVKATATPVVKATVHVYCAGVVAYCETDACAAICKETRFPTPIVEANSNGL